MIPVHAIDKATAGLLLIGDPHLWSKRPGTRRDASFLGTVIGKLEQAAHYANENNLWPVVLGDLLHDDRDNDSVMLVRLARVLQMFDRRPVTLVGNHDKEGLLGLDEKNALLLMGVTMQIDLIDASGFWGILNLQGPNGQTSRVAIGGTPYGDAIPTSVAGFAGLAEDADVKAALSVDQIVWLTHDDLAFGQGYPGALPLHVIHGVDVAINGHIHAPHRPHACGTTTWYNPGNITRLTIDLAEQKPSVWGWSPFLTETVLAAEGIPVPALQQFVLKHAPALEVFNFEGRHATADALSLQVHVPEMASNFVALLKADRLTMRTDDGTHIGEAIAVLATARSTPAPAQTIVQDLFLRALKKEPDSKRTTKA